MSKGLKLFGHKVCPKNCLGNCKDCEQAEKELKAFNIIKKNNMIIPIKGSDNRCWLESQMLDAKRISQEEYDILKEALDNDD